MAISTGDFLETVLVLAFIGIIFSQIIPSLKSKIKEDGRLITLLGGGLILTAIALLVSGNYRLGIPILVISLLSWISVFPTIKRLIILKSPDKNQKIALYITIFILSSLGITYLILNESYVGVTLIGIVVFSWFAAFPTIQHSLTLKPRVKNQIIALNGTSVILFSIGTILVFAGKFISTGLLLASLGIFIFAFGYLLLLYHKYKEGYEKEIIVS